MDPLALSTSFATIIGLISIFKQERKSEAKQDHKTFLNWLEYHKHDELKQFIIATQDLPSEIDRLLQEDHEVIIAKLTKIDEVLASLSSQIQGISGLAHILQPRAELSVQAIDILRQLVNSNSDEFGKSEHYGGPTLSLNSGGVIAVKEPRFLDDDLKALAEMDLLRLRFGPSTGTEFYGITRNAVRLIEAMDR